MTTQNADALRYYEAERDKQKRRCRGQIHAVRSCQPLDHQRKGGALAQAPVHAAVHGARHGDALGRADRARPTVADGGASVKIHPHRRSGHRERAIRGVGRPGRQEAPQAAGVQFARQEAEVGGHPTRVLVVARFFD